MPDRPNSRNFAGLVVDYHTPAGYTKRVRLATGVLHQCVTSGVPFVLAGSLRRELKNKFSETMAVLRNPEFQELLLGYDRARGPFYVAYEAQQPRFLDLPGYERAGARVSPDTQKRIDEAVRALLAMGGLVEDQIADQQDAATTLGESCAEVNGDGRLADLARS